MKGLWVITAYLLCAAYILADTAAYVYNPYFGRISALVCSPDGRGDSHCAVTIYGFREIYQVSFKAEEYYGVVRVDRSHGTSDTWTCGITLLTAAGKFNYVHPYQPCSRIEPLIHRINQKFHGGPAPRIVEVYLGFNGSLYRRLLVLVLGFYAVLNWHKWSWLDRLARFNLAAKTNNPALRLALGWWQANALTRLTFNLLVLYLSALWSNWYPTEQADFFSACYQTLQHYCGTCAIFPLGSWLCLYPFLTFTTLQALVQWKFLQGNTNQVSGWWIAAPLLAVLPLAFLLAHNPQCSDCKNLRFAALGLLFPGETLFTVPLWGGLLAYLLLLGLLQALAWQKKSTRTWGWSLAPLVNTGALWLTGWAILSLFNRREIWQNKLLPVPLLILLTLVLLFLLQDSLTALYLAWMREPERSY